MTDRLMSADDVAAELGIKPQSVRSTMKRYGATEQRGYRPGDVARIKAAGYGQGQGRRTDLRAATTTPEETP